MAEARVTPQFWRCGRCGTPNPLSGYVKTCVGCGSARPVGAEAIAAGVAEARASRWARRLAWASWAYAVLVLLALVLIRWVGSSWSGVTLLLFAPRWIFLGPIAALIVASGVGRHFRHWALQGAILLVVAGPLMNLNLPLWTLWESAPAGRTVRVISFNMGQYPMDVDAFTRWADAARADVIFIQEGLRKDPKLVAYFEKGWYLNHPRSIASRFPIVEELDSLAEAYDREERYSSAVDRVNVKTPEGRELCLVTIHLPTLRRGFERAMQGDFSGLSLHNDWWGREISRALTLIAEDADRPMILGGDFNMPPDDATMAALRTSFRFAFEDAGWGYGYTRPAVLPWVRIDHLLASPEWSARRCRVGPDLGSDHLPIVAEWVLPAEAVGR